MKYIQKQQPPHELIAWTHAKALDAEKQPMDWGYDDIPSEVRDIVKEHLIQEQGGICCYTGRAITSKSSHIEHLKPQELCVNHEDTEYGNLLAAYPAPNMPGCAYGAHAKANWYDTHLFVHPLRRNCENRFRYKSHGKISPTNPDDQGAIETIAHLRLDHPLLERMRDDAVQGALFDGRPLSKGQVERLMAAMDERDGNGHFRKFCFVIKQACEKYLKRFD
ncbi:MAG: TIGR02646 family protein [Anaerolineae bacterium]|nr:TIGR02646 family protein [Anaerolineae bacterium]